MKFNGGPKTGLIECKYRAEAIDNSWFLDYYKKQCETLGKIADEKPTDETANKSAKEVAKTDYIALLNEMWADPSNRIDIYTVKYEETLQEGNFIVTPLKTFPNPKGVFIIVGTNFNPPASINKFWKMQILLWDKKN